MNSHQNDQTKLPDAPPKLLDCIEIVGKSRNTVASAITMLETNCGGDGGLQGVHHGLGRVARYLRFLQAFPPFITANLAREEAEEGIAKFADPARASTPEAATILSLMRALAAARIRMLKYGERHEEITEIEDAVFAGAIAVMTTQMDQTSRSGDVMPRGICLLIGWQTEKPDQRGWISEHHLQDECTVVTMSENVPKWQGDMTGRFVERAYIYTNDLQSAKFPEFHIARKLSDAMNRLADQIGKGRAE